jgi:hypothetical protein
MKHRTCSESRRKFLKLSAGSTAGIIVGSAALKKAPAGTRAVAASQAWQNGMRINPEIDNLRVVFCQDEAMNADAPENWSWSIEGQNNAVDTDKVHENMDKMAMALAEKGTAVEAWSTIFMRPENKDWSQVRVAIKNNFIERQDSPRIAVTSKVCQELINLGVQGANITIYDGGGPSSNHYNNDYSRARLPGDIKLEEWAGGEAWIDIDGENVRCCRDLADGVTDILVNIGVNKGHDRTTFTLSMKNHCGSIKGNFDHFGGDRYPIVNKYNAWNKSDIILGGSPVRQQLVIIDALWSMVAGPFGAPDRANHTLLMGTFGPTVDYLTVKKVREEMMSVDNDRGVYENSLDSFGYDPNSSEMQNLEPIDALSYQPPDPGDTQAPSVPQNLSAEVPATIQIQIDLSWETSTDNEAVTGYNVYRDGEKIGDTAETSYSDTDIDSNTDYSYTVSAVDEAGNESEQSEPAEAAVVSIGGRKGPGSGIFEFSIAVPSQPARVRMSLKDFERTPLIGIYNMEGRRVRVIRTAYNRMTWDGRDQNGSQVPAGTYMVVLESETRRRSAKLLLK